MRDQAALVREACKWEYEVRFPEQVPELLDRAYAIATSTPKGPVYLSLPREVLCEPCPPEALAAPPTMAPAVLSANPDDVVRAAQLLARAEQPLIIAQRGAGTEEGFAALADIADHWSIPVCQWWAVATAISAEHPMYVGQDPGPWLAESDVVMSCFGEHLYRFRILQNRCQTLAGARSKAVVEAELHRIIESGDGVVSLVEFAVKFRDLILGSRLEPSGRSRLRLKSLVTVDRLAILLIVG